MGSLTSKETLLCLFKERQTSGKSDRINNICVYGVPEETEGNLMVKFKEQLLTSELPLLDVFDDISLQIQHAHRPLAQKPRLGLHRGL